MKSGERVDYRQVPLFFLTGLLDIVGSVPIVRIVNIDTRNVVALRIYI